MKSIFEQMGGTYRQEGDYLIPNLSLPDESEYQIGKYGRMRRRYLKEHRAQLAGFKNIFQMLVNGGSLYSKQLGHSFLRQPDGFISDDGVDGNILLRRVVHQKAEGVVHQVEPHGGGYVVILEATGHSLREHTVCGVKKRTQLGAVQL